MHSRQSIGELPLLVSREVTALFSQLRRKLLLICKMRAQSGRSRKLTTISCALSQACKLMPDKLLIRHDSSANPSDSKWKMSPPSNISQRALPNISSTTPRRVESDPSVFHASWLASRTESPSSSRPSPQAPSTSGKQTQSEEMHQPLETSSRRNGRQV